MSDQQPHSRRSFLTTAGAAIAAASIPAQLGTSTAASALTRKAPQWDISEWINGDAGNVDTLKGKVVLIDFFQLWCPGCNKFSGPLLTYWQKRFASEMEAGRLVMVKIHTVFEGHSYQTVERLKSYVKEKNITIPVGVDRHIEGGRIPVTMERYRTSGTPEMVFIDTDGMIAFQKFGYFEPVPAEQMVVEMLELARA